MQVRVQRPAGMVLPQGVQRVLLVNRTQGSARASLQSIIPSPTQSLQTMLTTEVMSQLQQAMQPAARYQLVVYDKILAGGGPSCTGFGQALTWPVVENMCKATQTDCIIALEYFDGDFAVTQALLPTPTGVLLAKGVSRAAGGFRIYYPKAKTIVFQDDLRKTLTWTESSVNIIEALAKLLKGPDALRESSRALGATFGEQFQSYTVWRGRMLFVGRKDPEMTLGYRLALSNDWAAARDAWGRAYDRIQKPKAKGRAAYNMALAYEVLGNLDDARKWATQAYVLHGDPRAQRYGYILDNRVSEQALVDAQNKH